MKLSAEERLLFPITSLESFIRLVETHIAQSETAEPNLAYLSILFGYLEHELTTNKIIASDSVHENNSQVATETKLNGFCNVNYNEFPVLNLEIIDGLLEQFTLMIKAQIDKSLPEYTTRSGYATKLLCKRVSDVIWNGLLRSYHKDKAHIQSLFSYMTGKQLDCFGLAFAVIAACQILNYKDVHLVISGDHAWAACGEDSKEMVEITWHGRGTEDRRGFRIDKTMMDKSWLYHGGKPVKCNRWMEFAALLLSLNTSIDIHTESEELQLIQHSLLRNFYNLGHLDKYPMALGCYSELHEATVTDSLITDDVMAIHDKALSVVKEFYDDLHILPYCGKGHSCMRQCKYKEALKCYSKAAEVASKYNYRREDEEIYKEMIDIASDLIPQALKSDTSLCEDIECYLDVIKFYDGICLWEEDSSTPVLHSWWARYFTLSLSRFSSSVREFFKEGNVACSDDSSRFEEDADFKNTSSPSTLGNAVLESDSHCSKKGKSIVSGVSSFPANLLADEKSAHKPTTKLQLCSQKMTALKEMLTSAKKVNSQAVGLLLTAQSQVHFVKRRSNTGDYSMAYGGSKRVRRSRDPDT